MRRQIALATSVLGLAVLGISSPAHATGSVTAGDQSSRLVGHAFASCTAFLGDTDSLQSQIYFPVPGKGAVVGQAWYFHNKGPQLAALLAQGKTPQQIIDMLKAANTSSTPPSDPALRPLFEDDGSNKGPALLRQRQYLISSLDAPGAAYTGDLAPDAKADQTFAGGVAAGNTLTNTAFVGTMADGFANATGSLADHLIGGLNAAFGQPGQGDSRCVNGAISRSSSMAWLRIDAPDGSTPVNLRARSKNNFDAEQLLVKLYAACRNGTGACDANYNDDKPLAVAALKGMELQMLSTSHIQRLKIKGWSRTLGDAFQSDPRVDPASVEIKVDGSDSMPPVDLAPNKWRPIGAGFTFADHNSPISYVRVQPRSGRIEIEGRGPFAFPLGTQPTKVDVIFRSGINRLCMEFTAATKFVPGRLFVAKPAPAPASC